MFLRGCPQPRRLIQATGPSFPAGTPEHSPYWVHPRNWKPLVPDRLGSREEQGLDRSRGLAGCANDGQWGLRRPVEPAVHIELGVRPPPADRTDPRVHRNDGPACR